MALTYTPVTDPKIKFPDFELRDVFGVPFKSSQVPDKNVKVLMFICNHCPYVQAIEDRLIETAKSFVGKAVSFLAVCSNDWTEHPEDSPAELAKRAKGKQYPFTYLVDDSQSLAKKVGAVCTPDFFVFSSTNELVYRGRLDDSWKNPALVKRKELYNAILSTLESKQNAWEEIPSMGCSIKWKDSH